MVTTHASDGAVVYFQPIKFIFTCSSTVLQRVQSVSARGLCSASCVIIVFGH